MKQEEADKGVIAVLLKRFETESYPRAQSIKKYIDEGAVLNDRDLSYLEETLEHAHQIMTLIARHPEYAALAKEAMLMYEEIMSKSQQNSSKLL
jgi:hypothetical protein